MAISCHSLIRKKSKGQTKKTLRYATERHSLFANFSSSIHTFFFKRYTEERQQRRRACVCACVVISSEADKKMKELNERQMRASLENSRAPLFSHLQCCGVVRPTREHLGQNSPTSLILHRFFGVWAVRGGVTGRPEFIPPYWYFAFFSDGFRIWKHTHRDI